MWRVTEGVKLSAKLMTDPDGHGHSSLLKPGIRIESDRSEKEIVRRKRFLNYQGEKQCWYYHASRIRPY